MVEYFVDGQAMRFLIVLTMPFLFCVVHFFLVRLESFPSTPVSIPDSPPPCRPQSNVIGVVAQIIGPVAQMQRNTKYYSGIKPERMIGPLPHIVSPFIYSLHARRRSGKH